jgi:hypothetical protein
MAPQFNYKLPQKGLSSTLKLKIHVMEAILETWDINNRINLYLLEAIDDANLSATSASKGRTVGEQWAHVHNVRLMWLKEGLPEALTSVQKIEKQGITKAALQEQLSLSATAIHQMLSNGLVAGKIKGSNLTPPHFWAILSPMKPITADKLCFR